MQIDPPELGMRKNCSIASFRDILHASFGDTHPGQPGFL
jgi:hypothetical protein